MKRVALALSALLFAACDVPLASSSIDAGPPDASGLECDENPCLNGGTCNLLPDGFRCLCPAGYEGQLCETDVDDCEPNPCKNGGLCTDRVASYQCECAPGFTGVDCSTNVDDCADAPCQNGGTCTDMVNGFQCDCAVGYTGSSCEVDVDDCAGTPCDNEAECQDEVNGFSCICKAGNTGPTCSNTVETCKEDTCKNSGTCEDGENGFVCTCAAGWNGVTCETDINDCAALPCMNGANCVDKLNGYECECDDGFEGVNCESPIDPCNPNPCQHDGQCTSNGLYPVCACIDGYNGTNCENDIDDCQSTPCANNGVCTDKVDGFECACTVGFGPTCSGDRPATCPGTDPCDHGTCKDGQDGYTCDCDTGYTGALCEVNVNDCANTPCGDHGMCADGVNQYTCTCDAGYEGPECQTDIDDCDGDPCENGGECNDLVNGFECDCVDGWTGDKCQTDVDECDPNPCEHGSCDDTINDYTCTCTPGWVGDQCETDECTVIGACGHGICDGQGGCTCDTGWDGARCNLNIDECMAGVPCQNGGTCMDTQGDFTCMCTAGYEGEICDGCADGYQDNDNDDICCADGYAGSTCLLCDDGYESVNGACKRTCVSSPISCGAHGMCDDSGNEPVCACDATWVGPLCDSLVGTCTGDPCGVNGDCGLTSDNTFKCLCDTGFIGRNCEEPDQCAPAPCQNGGTCSDGNNMYTCQCASGWLGANCDEVDNCVTGVPQDGPCTGHGLCTDGNNAYTCACVSGWLGDTCAEADDCVGDPCKNGAQCNDLSNGFDCDCVPGWMGATCETDVDECNPDPCVHGTCDDTINDYTCTCTTGYEGEICDDCADGYQDNDSDNICCPDGYAGSTCLACDSGYELVTGACKRTCVSSPISCGAHGMCDDSGNEPMCACDATWVGPLCDSLVGTCTGDPCGVNGDCSLTSDNTFKCLCDTGFIGRNCEEPDQCAPAPCQNGATCTDGNNTYTCQCASGWLGTNCDEVDNCVTGVPQDGPCTGHGLCTDGNNAYTCACVSGWLGDTCAEPDNCIGNDCVRGVCEDGNNTFTCDCDGTGYDGDKCQNKVFYCPPGPCKHGGTCSELLTTFSCDCDGTGFTGTTCEDDVDECADVQADVCGMGTCINGGDGTGYRCECPDGTIDVDSDGRTCSPVVSLAAGSLNTCAITAAGSLHCWGDNAYGQLAQGTETNPASTDVRLATRIGTGTGWTKVGVGHSHVCGLRSGHLYCWGNDTHRQVSGANAEELRQLEVRPDIAWTDVSVGYEHTCALATNDLYCWGNSTNGQAGTPASGTNVDAPKQYAGVWTSVSAGGTHTCAINAADQLHCWGNSTMLGGSQPLALPVGNSGPWTSVKAGVTHTCAVAGSKTYCWGTGTEGALGHGAFTDSATPVEVTGLTFGSLQTGENFSCGTINDADAASTFQINCWGSNQYSLLQTVDLKVNVPQVITRGGTPAWTAYAVGAHHMCAVEDGLLYCWGSNADGTIGDLVPGSTPVSTATLVKTPDVLHSVIDFCSPTPCKNSGICSSNANGYTCNCAGTGFSGTNCTTETDECATAGICGDGACRDRLNGDGYSCTCPDGKIDMDQTGTTCLTAETIAAGYNHTCVLTETSRTLHCWGSNRYGQFGLGAEGTSPYYENENSQTIRTPLRLSNVASVTSDAAGWTHLAVGESHTCATLPNALPATGESLYCWGNNAQGQLGRTSSGSNDFSPAPFLLDSTRTWTTLVAGYTHNCGISAGQLFCWGQNTFGQVGNGTLTTPAVFSTTPVALPAGDTSWVGLTLGSVHTCAITDRGNTWCWGRRNNGVLGHGATTGTLVSPTVTTGTVSAPVNLATPQGFTSIVSDHTHTCGKRGSTTYCWGNNSFGGIGIGSIVSPQVTPVEVSGSPNYGGLGLGRFFSCGLVPVMGSSPQAYTLTCWGDNSKNILLDASKTEVNVPTAVMTSRQWRTVEVGSMHICGVDNSDGKLYCWGDNGLEQSSGQGKLGWVAAGLTGNFGIGVVKAAAAIHEAQ